MKPQGRATVLEEPRLARLLFADTRVAPLWLVIRLPLGLWWLEQGRQRVTSSSWMHDGAALGDGWRQMIESIPGSGPRIDGWQRVIAEFGLSHGLERWLAPIAAVGQTLVGLALILGALTSVAALLGLVLGASTLLGGAGNLDPLVLLAGISLILAWKTAGWIGFDRWLMPLIGMPWRTGGLATAAGQRRSERVVPTLHHDRRW